MAVGVEGKGDGSVPLKFLHEFHPMPGRNKIIAMENVLGE
jgi:hypothetical protein